MLHFLLHITIPLLLAVSFYRSHWLRAFVLLMLGMVIDIDHLLADPIYDPSRCSIGFHPLHTLVPAGGYLALFAHERTRVVGLGLLTHLSLDAFDCQLTHPDWFTVLLGV